MLDTLGLPIGAPIRISQLADEGSESPRSFNCKAVFNNTDEEYFVIWNADSTDGGYEVFGQRLSALDGSEVGPQDYQITTDRSDDGFPNYVFRPDVAYNSLNNEYFVIWEEWCLTCWGHNVGGYETEIYGSILGTALGEPRLSTSMQISQVGPPGDGDYSAGYPAVAYNSRANEYLVVWESNASGHYYHQDNQVDWDWEIYGQRIDASSGKEIGIDDFRISHADSGWDTWPFDAFDVQLAYNPAHDEYLAVWWGENAKLPVPGSWPTQGEYEIVGQRIDGTLGVEIGANDFRISDMGPGADGNPTFGAYFPTVAYGALQNEYLVVWEGDDTVDGEFEIFGQRITGLAEEFPNRFSPRIDLMVAGITAGTLSGGTYSEITRTSTVYLDEDDLPGSRTLHVNGGSVDLGPLFLGAELINSSATLTVELGGQTIEAATGTLVYVVSEIDETKVTLVPVVTKLDVHPTIMALLPLRYQEIEDALVGYRVADAWISSHGEQEGFTFHEVFDTAKKVSSDYKGYNSQLTIEDVFSSQFYRTPSFSGELMFRSDFTSRNDRFSAGTFSSQFMVQGHSASVFRAASNPITTCDGGYGEALLEWNVPGVSGVEIRLGSTLDLLGQGGAQGSLSTGRIVSDGDVVLLTDATSGDVLGRIRLHLTHKGCPNPQLQASPNPIRVCDGGPGQTTLSWQVSGSDFLEVRVGSSEGTVLAKGKVVGSAQTGKWVKDGMTFYLVNPNTQIVLATETVTLTTAGCHRRLPVSRRPWIRNQ